MLQAIADSTKVPLALLAGLERGDIEDWPSGLFGRAHFRAYAAAIGLSPEPLLSEFVRLSGKDDAAPAQEPATRTADDGLRLTLGEERRWDIRSIGMRALATTLDLCGILAIAAVSARILPADLPLTCAFVTLSYYGLTTMALGQSVTLWWLRGGALKRAVRGTATARNVVLIPRRQLRASDGQESAVDFGEDSPAPVAASRLRPDDASTLGKLVAFADDDDAVIGHGEALRITRQVKPDLLARGNPHVFIDDAAPHFGSLPDRDILEEERILYHGALFDANVREQDGVLDRSADDQGA